MLGAINTELTGNVARFSAVMLSVLMEILLTCGPRALIFLNIFTNEIEY